MSRYIITGKCNISTRKDAEKKYRAVFDGALEGIYRTSAVCFRKAPRKRSLAAAALNARHGAEEVKTTNDAPATYSFSVLTPEVVVASAGALRSNPTLAISGCRTGRVETSARGGYDNIAQQEERRMETDKGTLESTCRQAICRYVELTGTTVYRQCPSTRT